MKKQRKSVVLIVVIFLMLIFAVLGTTLMDMQSGDFELSLGTLDSERALYLAESGAEWALQKLKDGFDCNDFNPLGSPSGILHDFSSGQYRICCSCTDSPPQCIDSAELIIEARGYLSSEVNFRSQRQVKLFVTQSTLAMAGKTRNLFDFSNIDKVHSTIKGDLQAGHFEGDGDGIHDEECEDYGEAGNCDGEQVPPGYGDRLQGVTSIPYIDMEHFKERTAYYNPNQVIDYSATATVIPASGGTTLKISGGGIFDNSMVSEVLRIVGKDWSEQNWVVISQVKNSKKVEVELKPGIIDDIGVWAQEEIIVVKRFEGNNNNQQLWYIEGSDILIDVRNGNGKFEHTSLIAEGDIVMIGTDKVFMKTHVDQSAHETFPNLATEDGNIYSDDLPSNLNQGRRFDGLIYSYNGDIRFNCIDGIAIIGNNVTLSGLVSLKYDDKYINEEGFLGNIFMISWQEQ